MKKLNYKFIAMTAIFLSVAVYSCKKSFLDKLPSGAVGEALLANKTDVNGLLIGAYSLLDGVGGAGGNVESSPDNFVWGSIVGGDSNKGSDPSDNAPDMQQFSTWKYVPTSTYLPVLWNARYEGVLRCNEVLRILKLVKNMSPAEITEVAAETRFLRGHYYFELKKNFNNVPYLDETISYSNGNWHVPNTIDIWPKIEADFSYAMANLPATQPQVARANKYAAEAFLAKVYMFEHQYANAKPLLTDVINNGVTASGAKYALNSKFSDNFYGPRNGNEAVFTCQYSVNDGSSGSDANLGDALNFPVGSSAPGGCCGWNQPTYSLVNSFKTDAVTGLPDPAHFNDADMPSDEGILSTQPFTPYSGPVDPRLDWTVGRRGIPYLDWGVMPGHDWIRNQGFAGPYIGKKTSLYKSMVSSEEDASWGNLTSVNYTFMRLSDVILMAAECEVEVGSLDQAQTYVNMIRIRAANPAGFVTKPDGTPAANYVVKNYPPGFFLAQGQANARTYVQFERKIELAMEGHRFYDLVRWGTADYELNTVFVPHESQKYSVLVGAHFEKGKAEYFPIPQSEIDQSAVNGVPVLVQNPIP
ncbi:MAG TPA: RagB/SusD family nutrient uptake outer membrane protein [Mucilaginibacter sp.]|jgi:hypothetical protein